MPPLFAKSIDTVTQRNIDALSREIKGLIEKRRGIETALALRQQKLNRLKSQQVLNASRSGSALPALECCG